ncbi:hypothetical protein BaRGS_00009832 [Batillaria attramentaria]|uniref:Uncharacterized protein n=1 Tax=Batillaria attramentaria TaxID=370345 RepID=A0ABD0LIT0_9CAEN
MGLPSAKSHRLMTAPCRELSRMPSLSLLTGHRREYDVGGIPRRWVTLNGQRLNSFGDKTVQNVKSVGLPFGIATMTLSADSRKH